MKVFVKISNLSGNEYLIKLMETYIWIFKLKLTPWIILTGFTVLFTRVMNRLGLTENRKL